VRRTYLVRHGKAGDRHRFHGEDRDRPLTANGLRQADQLAKDLGAGEAPPDRVLSSPAERCRQTVHPLATRAGHELEVVDWLDEGSDPLKALALITQLDDEVVVACTHGDVIWGILEWLSQGGVDIGPKPDAQKASTWVLDWERSPADGLPVRAKHLPPPSIT
jgi:8-oxo-dGTP diphosphatase